MSLLPLYQCYICSSFGLYLRHILIRVMWILVGLRESPHSVCYTEIQQSGLIIIKLSCW